MDSLTTVDSVTETVASAFNMVDSMTGSTAEVYAWTDTGQYQAPWLPQDAIDQPPASVLPQAPWLPQAPEQQDEPPSAPQAPGLPQAPEQQDEPPSAPQAPGLPQAPEQQDEPPSAPDLTPAPTQSTGAADAIVEPLDPPPTATIAATDRRRLNSKSTVTVPRPPVPLMTPTRGAEQQHQQQEPQEHVAAAATGASASTGAATGAPMQSHAPPEPESEPSGALQHIYPIPLESAAASEDGSEWDMVSIRSGIVPPVALPQSPAPHPANPSPEYEGFVEPELAWATARPVTPTPVPPVRATPAPLVLQTNGSRPSDQDFSDGRFWGAPR